MSFEAFLPDCQNAPWCIHVLCMLKASQNCTSICMSAKINNHLYMYDFYIIDCIIQSSDCVNGGIANTTSCMCECEGTGYGGETCSEDIDECADSTICQNGGSCTNIPGTYNCTCVAGYEGNDCEIDINECAIDPCINGICIDLTNMYECNCTAGYTGVNCDELICINECDPNPCLHPNGNCTDLINDYSCSCVQQYMGMRCELDVDECLITDICENGGTCNNEFGGYNCTCVDGYEGM